MNKFDILCNVGALGLVGMHPTPSNELLFITGCKFDPKPLALFDGDRLKVWIKAGYPPVSYDILFPEWNTLSKPKQQFITKMINFLYNNRRSFFDVYPAFREKIPKDAKGIFLFTPEITSDKKKNLCFWDNIYDIMKEDDHNILQLLDRHVQWFLID